MIPYCPNCGKCPTCGRPQFEFQIGLLPGGTGSPPLDSSGSTISNAPLEPFEGATQHDEPNITDGDLLAGP